MALMGCAEAQSSRAVDCKEHEGSVGSWDFLGGRVVHGLHHALHAGACGGASLQLVASIGREGTKVLVLFGRRAPLRPRLP